jgi:hypothetical protein
MCVAMSANYSLHAAKRDERSDGDVLTQAELLLSEAERIHTWALGEKDKQKQHVMLAVADHYYLLHDRLLELQRLVAWQSA